MATICEVLFHEPFSSALMKLQRSLNNRGNRKKKKKQINKHDTASEEAFEQRPPLRNVISSLMSVRRASNGTHMRTWPSARFPRPLTSHKCTQERPVRLIHDNPCWKHVPAPPLFCIEDRARCTSPFTASTSKIIPNEQSQQWWLPCVLAPVNVSYSRLL